MTDQDKLNRVLDTLETLLVKGEEQFNAPMINDVPDDVLDMLNARREDIKNQPNLGCATTRELLVEICARGEVASTSGVYPQEMGDMAIGAANLLDSLPGSMLDYRTADL